MKKINPYNKLRSLVEVRGTESEAMKQIIAVTKKIQAEKAKKERGQAASKEKNRKN